MTNLKEMESLLREYAREFMDTVKADANGLYDAAFMPQIILSHELFFKLKGTEDWYAFPADEKRRALIEQYEQDHPGSILFDGGATDGKTIYIYGATYFDLDTLKTFMRHEMLHCILWQCGFSHHDIDIDFCEMLIRYDAVGIENTKAYLDWLNTY